MSTIKGIKINGGFPFDLGTEVDDTLTEEGLAADAKKVGDEIADLKSAISQGTGLTNEAKQALLALLANVAYIDEDGQDYLDAFESALYPPANLVSISAVFTQGQNVIYDTDSLSTLKQYLVVTAHYSDSTSAVVTAYTLSGSLTAGTSTITVTYGDKTDTFTVTVTHLQTSEVIDTYVYDYDSNQTTFEDTSNTNTHIAKSTIQASKINLSWDTTELNMVGIKIQQFDSSGNPYKVSTIGRYAADPVTDGSTFDTATGAWSDPGASSKYTTIAGGNMTINLPTSGLVKISLRFMNNTSGSSVTSNATFKTWIQNGGLTITAYV